MFGRQDSSAQDAAQIPDQSIDNALSDDTSTSSTISPSADSSSGAGSAWQHPGTPLNSSDSSSSNSSTPHPAPLTVTPPAAPPTPATPSDDSSDNSPASDDSQASDVDANSLIDIKQQALSQLGPLVGHLDQSPEDKFRTTMMMIQASDDQSLIQTAYQAAQQIQDEKSRAQALLDIINEINYFTQHQQ